MADYKKLTETQEYVMIGRTYFMWRDGSTNAEIAECLQRPIEEVNEWVEMCESVYETQEPVMNDIVR